MLTLNCGSQHEILKHAEKSPSLTLRHKLFYAYTEKVVDLSVHRSRVSANVPRLGNTAESRALEESELGVTLTLTHEALYEMASVTRTKMATVESLGTAACHRLLSGALAK